MTDGRIVSWFSCGAASAAATKLALSQADPAQEFVIANCELKEEHPDNKRFLRDCEKWFGQSVIVLGNDKYERSTDVVYRKTRYLVGPGGARCTTELKKNVRKDFQQADDTIVFGYTVEEKHRLDRFMEQNAECHKVLAPLIDAQLDKSDCLAMIDRAGIEIPAMYRLGYSNNNCIGCVKGGMTYWNKIRRDFPDRFAEMARIERELGNTVLRADGLPIYLDELDPGRGLKDKEPEMECSFFCVMAEEDIKDDK